MNKNTLKISTASLIFALSATSGFAADLGFEGSATPDNPVMLSTYFKGQTSIDGYLASYGVAGISETDYTTAYVGVDGNYTAYYIILSSSNGGPYANLDFAFQEGSSITLTKSPTLSYNSKDWSGVAFNFHLAEGATSAQLNLNVGLAFDFNSTSETAKRNLTIGKGLTVNSTGAVSITGAEGSAFTMNGNWSTTDTTTLVGAKFDIGGTYSASKAISATGASNITVAEGATLSASSDIELKDTSHITVNGTVTANNITLDRNDTAKTYATISVGENAVINATSLYMRSGSANLDLIGNAKVNINRTTILGTRAILTVAGYLTVAEDAELSVKTTIDTDRLVKVYYSSTIDGKISLEGGSHVGLSTHGMIINSTGNTIKTNILLGETDTTSDVSGGKLIVNASNDFSEATLMTAQHKGKASNTSYLQLGANVDLKLNGLAFCQMATADTLSITFGIGSTLILNELIGTDVESGFGTLASDDRILINGFAENSFGIKNHTESDDTLLSQISAEGVDQLYWVKDDIANVWWLSANPAVPEPAEWAMIFGGIALGLAIYRRRK